MNSDFDVVIIGAGLAGINAALTLKNYDLNICVIDEGNAAGGQFVKYPLFKDINTQKAKPPSYKKGLEQVLEFNKAKLVYLKKSELIFINEKKELLVKSEDDVLYELKPKTIILATGAREIVQPFKGWDLPGVITTGAMQILLKSSGRTFAKEAIIAGSGILPYAAGATYLDKGGKIKAFYDSNEFSQKFEMALFALYSSDKRADFFSLLPKMMKLQTKAKNGYRVIEAKGKDSLESVVFAKIDNKGQVIKGSQIEEKTSLLAIGEGLVANLDVASLASCETIYDENLGGLIVKNNEKLETSVDGIFAAGALTAVGGADKAELEGKLCAYSVLEKLKIIAINEYREKSFELNIKRQKALKFSNLLAQMQKYDLNLLKNLDENTVICRCEDISLKQIKDAINSGFTSLNAIKKRTRAGMGNCQGNTCSEIIRNILASQGFKDEKAISVRPPLRPTSIAILASEIKELNFSWKK